MRDGSKRPRRPPCADNPQRWDLDAGKPGEWRESVRICARCPLRDACARRAAALIDEGYSPKSMIWAGVGYDSEGRSVADLDVYRSSPPSLPGRAVAVRTNRKWVHVEAVSQDTEPHNDTGQPPVRRPRRIIVRRGSPLDGAGAEKVS
ncbi:hypothetical protein [Nocardia sp. X0981]